MARTKDEAPLVEGYVAPGFEHVRIEFERNFTERGELGAACAVYHRGERIVDLWGGLRDSATGAPWREDTMVLMFSTTKGMAASAMAVAHAQGLFELDDRVADHWPEFAQAGKEHITLRELLSHQAGLCTVDEELTPQKLADPTVMSGILERQRPSWRSGTRSGYHYLTLGLYESQLLRRVDPSRRGMGAFFQDEVAGPLDAEFYIGLPSTVDSSRIAPIKAFRPVQMLLHMNTMPAAMVLNFMRPRSLAFRTLRNPKLKSPGDFDSPTYRALELPSAGGIGQVRAVAKVYGELACGGQALGITDATFAELKAPARVPPAGARDAVFGVEMRYSFGFFKPSQAFRFGSDESAFGTMGAGGSFGFADPTMQVGFCYAPSRMGFNLWDDPRERVLRDAVYRSIGAERG